MSEELIVGLVGIAITAFFASRWYVDWKDRIKTRAHRVAVQAIEMGVQQTWAKYVKQQKQSAADGKLTSMERSEAASNAYQIAREYARQQDVDLISVFTRDGIRLIIERVIAIRKAMAAISVPRTKPQP